RARRLDPRPEARPARLGLRPERWPGPRPGHRPGLASHPQRPLPGCAGADLPEPGRPFLSPPEGHAMSSLPAPLNLHAWIEQNRHLLKPPVGNKCIHDGDFIVMVVGGPNARTDFHLDEGPEWFYQLEGEMVLRVQQRVEGGPDSLREIPIRAGEIFLLPAGVPHSPQRMAGGVGLVIERKRLAHERDGLLWYCE